MYEVNSQTGVQLQNWTVELIYLHKAGIFCFVPQKETLFMGNFLQQNKMLPMF